MKFNTEMKQATLEDRKSQSRRVIKPQPVYQGHKMYIIECERDKWAFESGINGSIKTPIDHSEVKEKCPYGQVGDMIPLEDENGVQFGESEITAIRVERVQDISIQDSGKEGVVRKETTICNITPVVFQRLWDSIYKKRGFGWDENPWVWVIEFRRIAK